MIGRRPFKCYMERFFESPQTVWSFEAQPRAACVFDVIHLRSCHLVRLPGFDCRMILLLSLHSRLPVRSYLPVNDWSDPGDDVGAVVGGVIGGVVFLLGAALLVVLWKTGRLNNGKCRSCSGWSNPWCGSSAPVAATATAGTRYPVIVEATGPQYPVIATPAATGPQYPVPVAPADAAATQKASAGAPPAPTANLPTLPTPAYPTTADAPSVSTGDVPATPPPPPATNTSVDKVPPTPDTAADPPAYETPAKGWANQLDIDEDQSPPKPDAASPPPAYKTPAKGWAKQPADDEEQSSPKSDTSTPLPAYKTPAKDWTKHPADDQKK